MYFKYEFEILIFEILYNSVAESNASTYSRQSRILRDLTLNALLKSIRPIPCTRLSGILLCNITGTSVSCLRM